MVGVSVGIRLGRAEGISVGLMDGPVGFKEGTSEGESVIVKVGEDVVGVALGVFDGSRDG